jgi:hypothetical protein
MPVKEEDDLRTLGAVALMAVVIGAALVLITWMMFEIAGNLGGS